MSRGPRDLLRAIASLKSQNLSDMDLSDSLKGQMSQMSSHGERLAVVDKIVHNKFSACWERSHAKILAKQKYIEEIQSLKRQIVYERKRYKLEKVSLIHSIEKERLEQKLFAEMKRREEAASLRKEETVRLERIKALNHDRALMTSERLQRKLEHQRQLHMEQKKVHSDFLREKKLIQKQKEALEESKRSEQMRRLCEDRLEILDAIKRKKIIDRKLLSEWKRDQIYAARQSL